MRARLLDETVPETRIDRYVVIERLGTGGMGVVYEAHDSQLDRKVAIKLVRNWALGEHSNDQQRLIREARALAQLSHPNVVAIYDVGLHHGRVFIAMELVQGITLRRFVADGTRTWPDVLACLVQAGEGLLAAHTAGLVHRDFKPDNVLVGDDGRVRVLDFGLAQGDGSAPTHPALSSAAMMSLSLTATGKVVGTPAYMAPEQFSGAPADARTDQFSFCVACWEALFLERPFQATSTPQLRRLIAKGEIAKPSHPERAPEWLRTVLARGLAADPDARWPSLRALLDAFTPRPRRKPWKYGVAAVLGVTALTLGGVLLWQSHERAACERDASERAALWNPGTATAIVDAFTTTALAHARGSAERIDGLLDDYARTWAQTRAQSCLAHLDGTIDDATWQRRRACLDERRERLATLLEVLQAPDRDIVNMAVRVTYELPRASACEDDARLAANAAALGSDVDAERVSELRSSIARAELLAETARPDAVAAAGAIRDRAEALGDPGLVAEAELAVGTAHLQRGEYQPAADAYERAYFGAGPIGADEVALVAATQLVEVVGSRLARFDDGLGWSRHAEGLLPRSGSARPWREAQLAEHVASVLHGKGDYEGARASYERAIALRSEYAGRDHPAVGRAWGNLGSLLAEHRDAEGAKPALDEAERILVAAYGPDSLQLASIYTSRGSVEHHLAHYQASAEYHERALAIREGLLEPDHPSIAASLSNLATARLVLDDRVGARILLARVIELRRKKLGPLHPLLATALSNLGVVDTHLDDTKAAIEHLTEALQIRRTVLPPNHPDTAVALVNLGDAFQQIREHDKALPLYDEAARMTEGEGDVVAREHGRALMGAGMSRLGIGDPEQALADFETALTTPFADDADPVARCELRYGLARSLLATGGGGARVRELARTAFDECTSAGMRGAPILDELAAWARGAESKPK
ncbi:MAG TPA: serine/threonine-protein kinase [Nannocystaceae bacterium]|nr:serine/threonine-protein kinase [Nannocystaceae bacterium]